RNPLSDEAHLDRQLEQGDYEVLGVEALDEQAVYFTANQGDYRQQHPFAVNLDGTGFHRLSERNGFHEATLSDAAKHWLDRHSSAPEPPRLSMCAVAGPSNTIWESRSVADYDLVAPKFLEFEADDGSVLYGQLFLPPDTPSGKIPMIVNIYGGPAGQLVRDA